jgi:hypothetical protein
MSHQQLYKLPPLSQGRANGTSSSVAAANGGGDGDKIRQLQRLLLGVTKAIQTYLLEDIGEARRRPWLLHRSLNSGASLCF